MPSMEDIDRQIMRDIGLGNQVGVDTNQQAQIANLTNHIRVLWRHIERLEKALAISDGETILKSGTAAIHLRKNGNLDIKAHHVSIDASGDVRIRGSRVALNE